MRFPLPAMTGNRIGVALALFIGVLAVYPWLAPIPADLATVTSDDAQRRPPPLAVMPALTTFSAVFDRPLFSASRRPAVAAPSPNRDAATVANFRLLGVVEAPGLRHALVSDGGRAREVREGESLGGWTVTRIEHDGLLLSSAASRIELPLRPLRPPAPAAAPPRP